MPPWTLHFDGLYEPRYRPDGIATYGFVVRHGDEVVHEEGGLVLPPGEGGSANVAEFAALVHGLGWFRGRDLGGCPLHVVGDSRLVVETVNGTWKLSSERLLPLRDLARSLVEEVRPASLVKVPRDQNAAADALTRRAYHEAVAAHPEWGLGRRRP